MSITFSKDPELGRAASMFKLRTTVQNDLDKSEKLHKNRGVVQEEQAKGANLCKANWL